jgi:hypothetical protein
MFVRLLHSSDPRWWLGIGAFVGVGVETKLTVLALGLGLMVASAGQGLSINFDTGGVLAFVAFQPIIIGFVALPLWVMG